MTKKELKQLFAQAVEPDGISQSEFFKLREEGLYPLPLAEARARFKRDGREANALKISSDCGFIFVERGPIYP